MEPLTAAIFIGIPAVAMAAAPMAAFSVAAGWVKGDRLEPDDIPTRIHSIPIPPDDRRWVDELDALQLEVRHKVC